MKLNKRLGAVALASVFSLSLLAGCSGTDSADGSSADGKFEVGYVNLANTDVFCMSRIDALNAAVEGLSLIHI